MTTIYLHPFDGGDKKAALIADSPKLALLELVSMINNDEIDDINNGLSVEID